MNSIIFLAIALATVTMGTSQSLKTRFMEWVEKFEMKIENEEMHQHVFNNWVENDKYIETVNAENKTYTLGHNQFSGMDEDEFSKYLGYSFHNLSSKREEIQNKIQKIKCLTMCVENYDEEHKLQAVECLTECLDEDEQLESFPDTINWVEKGAVTPVKNQGQCGSCWSFSTTGALEGAYYIKYGKLESFSEQQLVSCDNFQHGGKDHGCNGGLMDNAFIWIEKNGGLCLETEYPYTSGDSKSSGTCENTCEVFEDSEIKQYVDVPANSDEAMMTALTQQPVSIAIQADQKDFQLYKSGVFTETCGTKLDHGVLVVGYGSSNGEDYYLIKNSWGTTWGDEGYIKLGRGAEYNEGKGQCGMLMQGSYPEL